MIDNSLNALLDAGFTRRSANEYLGAFKQEEESGLYNEELLTWAHAHGFNAESAIAYGLTDENYHEYLSDYDYARLWPLNSWERIWINDKLTLKYLLADTPYDHYLPKYYYYTNGAALLPLANSKGKTSYDGFLALLAEVGTMACKPCNGARAQGFAKLSYQEGTYAINGKKVEPQAIKDFIATHPNYVFTEFLRPCKELAKIDPVIHTLRLLVVNSDGVSPTMIGSYLRFSVGKDKSGSSANYTIPTDAYIHSFNAHVNLQTGEMERGCLAYANRIVASPKHPDSGVLVAGKLPFWDEITHMVDVVSRRLPAVEFLGYDIGITDDGPKIMEINSGSGISYLQLFEPLMKAGPSRKYFSAKLAALDALSLEELHKRANIIR